MKKNRSILRKSILILAFIVSAIILMPETLFAKGAVIGYAWGGNDAPSDDQLANLTHVMVVDLYIKPNGDVFPNPDLTRNNTNWLASWLKPLVWAAHQKGVKVSIVIGEGKDEITGVEYKNFSAVTANSTIRGAFVNNIKAFVNNYDLDGVDIDWEYPSGSTQWTNCIALLNELKTALPCKRISIALGMEPTSSRFLNQTIIPQQILTAADAIHLMTYDRSEWPTHSDVDGAKNVTNAWANLNPSLKEKLHIGCAFYGYNTKNSSLWSNATKVSYTTYSSVGFSGSAGDNTTSVEAKVVHCYNQVYGGVMIWHLGYDVPVTNTNPPSLLKKIWDTTAARGGYPITITISTQPVATPVTQGSISGSLSVAASTAKCIDYPFYQWYSTTTNSNTGGTKISGATNANFPIPTTLTAGTYYYFCEMKSGKSVVRSSVAKVTVAAPGPLSISGPTTVCSSGATFTCTNFPSGAIWDKSSNLTLSSTTNNPITAYANGSGTGWISVKLNNTELKSYNVWVGKPSDIEIDDGPTSTSTGIRAQYRTKLANGGSAARFEHDWSVSPNYGYSGYYPDMNWFSLTFNTSGTYTITAKAKNGCGTSNTDARRTVVRSSYYYSYPNPASNILNIEFDQEAITQAKSLEQTTTDVRQIKTDPTYDIRLCDGQGNLLQRAITKGGKVEFNVANLSNGIYYLHIYDGVNEKPEMRQVMVEH